jgi:phosphoglycolate phosphatase
MPAEQATAKAAAAPSRLVVFDFDGTLADTWRDIATALNRTLADVGLPGVEGPDVRFWIGDGAFKLLERAAPAEHRGDLTLEQLFEVFRDHYDRCLLDTTEPYRGVVECLDALAGADLAVASNKPTRFLARAIDGLGLKGYFAVVLGGDTLDVRKPDPRVLEHVVERLGARPSQVWFVGDSAIDIETGQNANARTIGCAWGLRGREELRSARPDYLVEAPDEIPPLVLGTA